jgi:signal transduction histidine kinase
MRRARTSAWAFDQAKTSMGTGTQGMSDRMAALGGTIEITSAPAAAPG